ncbi:MAG: DNA repair protein RadC [Holosporaceae bacterium]|jgi:DNA repair protein RadC|nr:DNA repair protein RadC [Holosporaceae bacterium]
MISETTSKKYNWGHRKRLKKRFVANPTNFPDYELLELLMFFVFARKDTKILAKTLLDHFKTIGRIVGANQIELKKIHGFGESAAILLAVIHEIFNRIHLESIKEHDIVISSSNQVLEYYKNLLENERKEQLHLMLLNNRNRLIADKLMQSGTINQTAIYPREIIQLALEYGASAIIMVHNHPSGDPQPSRQDIIMTKSIADVAKKLDILLLDHIIIGKDSSMSLKEMGMI